MAANYWASTQYSHWILTRKSLAETRQALEDADQSTVQHFPLPDRRHLSIFFQQQLLKLGKRIHVRQQALATAQVYIRRIYTRVEIRRTNPYLIVATALYLACKMEECPQHIRTIVGEARTLWPDFVGADVSKIGECEFFLISEMNCQLIVHHPYRVLTQLQKPLNIADDEMSLAWSIINDHYLTDLPLLYPLHCIAVTAVFLSLVLKPSQNGGLQTAAGQLAALAQGHQLPRDGDGASPEDNSPQQNKVQHLLKWVAEGEVDIKAMVECTQDIITLYEVWEQYNEKTCKEQIARFVKARNLDR